MIDKWLSIAGGIMLKIALMLKLKFDRKCYVLPAIPGIINCPKWFEPIDAAVDCCVEAHQEYAD